MDRKLAMQRWSGLRISLALTALALTHCGGETLPPEVDDGGQGTGPCEESSTLERLMIADFEGTPMASWFTGSDGTAPLNQLSPPPPSVFTTPLEAPKCPEQDVAAGSAFQILATGLQSYGYSFGFNTFTFPEAAGAAYFDASTWDGLSMWVRKGEGPSPEARSSSSFFAGVSERFTDPAGAVLFTPDEADLLLSTGTYCAYNAVDVTGDGVTDPTLSQCDRFGSGIGIATEWRFFKVPFSGMRQRAFGRPSAQSGVDTRIFGLDFGLDGENWDFWIDDIAFYRDTE
jgi:hypothetical protein